VLAWGSLIIGVRHGHPEIPAWALAWSVDRLGRSYKLEERVRKALNQPGCTEGVRKIAQRFGILVPTVQRISRPFEASAAAGQATASRCAPMVAPSKGQLPPSLEIVACETL
jgi:hypothetical protein